MIRSESSTKERDYFKEKFEEVKNELLVLRSKDSEIKLEAKVHDLQREMKGLLKQKILILHRNGIRY